MSISEHEPRRPSYQELLAAYGCARESYEQDPSPRSFAVLETGLQFLMQELHRPGKFVMGQLVMTPGAAKILREFLLRHKNGDWCELPEDDIQENEWALQNGARLFSAYQTRTDEKLWVITERDHSVTTLLMPAEY